jgi:murein DD-endopeptidase MepM/ murein hydrolase activator NlpD
MNRGGLVAVLCVSLALAGACSGARSPEPRRSDAADIVLAPETEVIHGRVPRNATLDSLLRDAGTREDLIPGIVSLARGVFDPRRLRTGQSYELVRTLDGSVRSFEYEIDTDRFLRIAAPQDRPLAELAAEVVPYRKERAIASVRGVITRDRPSLFEAMDAAGEKPDLSIALAEIFGGDIDFNSDLQPGDSFSVAFEKVFREQGFAGYGAIAAAEFVNEGRVLRAIRFTPPGGKPGYYDENGRSLRRFFLKSPLKFEPRVSSRFSGRRLHPILRVVRPHLGVDYLAPIGAPVVSVAGGVVTSAGFNGDAGRTVQIRHPNGYETYYLHLSGIAAGIRPGVRVEQGELIGRVGTSGLSTGPHLDYRIRKNGVFVNPLTEHRKFPPGEPLPSSCLDQFRIERDRALARLVPPSGSGSGESGR